MKKIKFTLLALTIVGFFLPVLWSCDGLTNSNAGNETDFSSDSTAIAGVLNEVYNWYIPKYSKQFFTDRPPSGEYKSAIKENPLLSKSFREFDHGPKEIIIVETEDDWYPDPFTTSNNYLELKSIKINSIHFYENGKKASVSFVLKGISDYSLLGNPIDSVDYQNADFVFEDGSWKFDGAGLESMG